MVWAAILALDQRDEKRFRHHVAALEAAADAHSPRQIRYTLEAFGGYVDVLDGRSEEGIARVRRALDDTSTGDAPAPGTPGILAHMLLAACLHAGAAAAGLVAADAALGTGRGAELWEAEMRRMRAQFLAAERGPEGRDRGRAAARDRSRGDAGRPNVRAPRTRQPRRRLCGERSKERS